MNIKVGGRPPLLLASWAWVGSRLPRQALKPSKWASQRGGGCFSTPLGQRRSHPHPRLPFPFCTLHLDLWWTPCGCIPLWLRCQAWWWGCAGGHLFLSWWHRWVETFHFLFAGPELVLRPTGGPVQAAMEPGPTGTPLHPGLQEPLVLKGVKRP